MSCGSWHVFGKRTHRNIYFCQRVIKNKAHSLMWFLLADLFGVFKISFCSGFYLQVKFIPVIVLIVVICEIKPLRKREFTFLATVKPASLFQFKSSKNKTEQKTWMFVPPPCARSPLRHTPRLPHHFQINSPSKQRKHCSRSPLPAHTHTFTCTLWAYEALFAVFLSRFPSLSMHKAWEKNARRKWMQGQEAAWNCSGE